MTHSSCQDLPQRKANLSHRRNNRPFRSHRLCQPATDTMSNHSSTTPFSPSSSSTSSSKSTKNSSSASSPWLSTPSSLSLSLLVPVVWVLLLALLVGPTSAAQYDFIHCEAKCNESLCPELSYCEGVPLKDSCNCCNVCSDQRYQPHALTPNIPPRGGEACKQVKCPKFKICSENMQGLPLCKCPSTFFCRKKKKREICASNGETYQSRCHMRIASCNLGSAVRKKYRGACSPDKDRRLKRRKMKAERRRGRGSDLDRMADDRKDFRPKRKSHRKNGGGGKDKKKKRRNRKRRKIGDRRSRGKRRTRRHRRNHHYLDEVRAFEEAFAHYTWSK